MNKYCNGKLKTESEFNSEGRKIKPTGRALCKYQTESIKTAGFN